MMPELYLADALGATGKPMLRVHNGRSVGGSTAIVRRAPGHGRIHRRVAYGRLREAVGQRRDVGADHAQPVPAPDRGRGGLATSPPSGAGYIERSGRALGTVGIRVAVKDRLNALRNPQSPPATWRNISIEKVASSPMLWGPIRYIECCPSSDCACAMVLAAEDALGSPAVAPGLGPRDGHAQRVPTVFAVRD